MNTDLLRSTEITQTQVAGARTVVRWLAACLFLLPALGRADPVIFADG